jgi:hypothetical protein
MLSLIFFAAATTIVMVFQRRGLHVRGPELKPRDIFLVLYMMCWIGSFIALKVEVTAWAFRNWDSFAKSEEPFQLGR